MKAKKVLFMLNTLPPSASANGVCAFRLLAAIGEENAVVLSYDPPEKTGGFPFPCYTIAPPRWDVYAAAQAKKKGLFAKLGFLFARIGYRVYRFFTASSFPLSSPETAKRFAAKAIEIIRKEEIDTVVAISYPAETLGALLSIKKTYKDAVRCIAYPLDASLVGAYRGTAIEKAFSRRGCRRFFCRVAKSADVLLALENALPYYEKLLGKDLMKKCRPVGIPLAEDNPLPPPAPHNGCRLVYTGQLLCGMRDVRPFLSLLSAAAKKVPLSLSLYGHADAPIQKALRRAPFPFTDNGWVGEADLRAGMAAGDILLNLGNEYPNLIPSKLFRYLSSGRPILHYAFSQNDPCLPYLNACGRACVIGAWESDDAAKEKLLAFLQAPVQNDARASVLFPTCTPAYTAAILKE